MSWITLTANDLKPYLAAAQLVALQTKALGVGQSDPTPELIADIVGRVRSLIASGGYALSATTGSIPEVLKGCVCALVIELAQTRIPGLTLTADQRFQADEARAFLARIASSLVKVEEPTNPDTTLTRAQAIMGSTTRTEQLTAKKIEGF